MIDYLSGIAQQAANPLSTMRPTLRPLFADDFIERSDLRYDEGSSIDEFTNVDSPASWREGKASQSDERESKNSSDVPEIPPSSEQPAFGPMPRRAHEVEDPSVEVFANECAVSHELQRSIASSHQPPQVTARSVPVVESSLEQQPAPPALVDVQRQETSSFKTVSHDSDFRRDPVINAKLGLQNSRTAHRSDKGALNSPRPAKPVLNERQKISGGIVNSVVENHFEGDFVLPSQEVQTSGRTKEIIPLSATMPHSIHSVRSQPAGSPVVQPAAETIVHVTIGRVEVRATVGQQKPAIGREPSSRQSSQSLEDYLRGASSGRSL